MQTHNMCVFLPEGQVHDKSWQILPLQPNVSHAAPLKCEVSYHVQLCMIAVTFRVQDIAASVMARMACMPALMMHPAAPVSLNGWQGKKTSSFFLLT